MPLFRLVLALLLAVAAGAAQAQTFPKFTGLVVDAADVLPPQVEQDLTAKLEALQKDTKRQLVVATIPDLQGYPLEDYGYRLLRTWGVGLRDVNNGVILFIAPNEPAGHRGPRIEVGYGLEGIITDALASTIVRQQMMPRLHAGDVPGAMVAGTDALVQQLRASPEEAQARLQTAEREFDQEHRRETRASNGGNGGALIFWAVIFLFVILPLLRRRGARGRRYRGSGSDLPIILWTIGNEIGRSRGGWGGGGGGFGGWGGGGSDGSWGGGGFTGGGGGSGGGGGASGDW